VLCYSELQRFAEMNIELSQNTADIDIDFANNNEKVLIYFLCSEVLFICRLPLFGHSDRR